MPARLIRPPGGGHLRALAALALGLGLLLAAAAPPASADGFRGRLGFHGGGRVVSGHLHAPRGVFRGHRSLQPRVVLRAAPTLRQRTIIPSLGRGFDGARRRVIIPSLGRGFDGLGLRGAPVVIIDRRALSAGMVVDRLLRRGFDRVKVVRARPDLLRLHAVDARGRRVRLLVDSFTGRLVGAKPLD